VLQKARPDLLLIDFLLQDLALFARADHVPCVLISTSLDEFRLPLIDGRDGLADEMPVLTLCPKDFDFPHAVPRKGRYYLEASIDLERQEPGSFPWHRLDQDRPLIFCTLGSHCEDYEDSEPFFRAVIAAMEKKPDWQLLLALGNPHADPADFQPVPPNVVLVNWAPQLAILERASIMMTHGGLGTVKECIYFGVPMIVFPVDWDQPENAARVSYHGLGVHGSIRSSAQQILHLIERVAGDSSFKARAESMGRTFREIETRGVGARLIEMIVGSVQKDGRV
jgi:MGT family glycosyltransferase